ncbi:MAG: sulfatase-like hydrolase/transferase [Kiritimatiellaeota bacterium]|nr:sulfatase-like hydrolase/transferase [Kiritimatiellota bacterium]
MGTVRKLPNIIIITTDHHSYNALASNGFNRYSPGSDRLAREGVGFSHATTTTVMCGPARCAMQTGMYPNYLGLPNNRWGGRRVRTQLLPPGSGVRTLPDYFRPAGYVCGFVGKLHMSGSPLDYGYDDYSQADFRDTTRNRHFQGRTFSEYLAEKKVDIEADPPLIDQTEHAVRYWYKGSWYAMSGRLTNYRREHTYTACTFDEGKRMIECYRSLNKPFLIQLNIDQAPHWPYIVPEPYASMYRPKEMKEWPNFRDPLGDHPLRSKIARDIWRTGGEPWERWAESISKYYGLCSLVEDEVADLLSFLDHNRLAEDSIVVWTADHGAPNGAHGVFDKDHRIIDEAYRIPLLVRYPRGELECGLLSDALVQNADVLPTIMELADLTPPAEMHSRSFAPALHGRPRARGEIDYCFLSNGGDPTTLAAVRAIRTHSFKYIFNACDIDELYDLRDDPAEMRNRIDAPRYARELKRLRSLLHDVLTDTDDWVTPFAFSRLIDGKDTGSIDESAPPPPTHYITGPHTFGLRTNCPWHSRDAGR